MKLRFIKKQHEVGIIYSFFFESDELKKWVPGEYFNLTMPDVPPVFADRLFSIASAPHEKLVQITTWIGPSPFKRRLANLIAEDEVEADQLGGDFTLQHIGSASSAQSGNQTKRVFLAGGIGITPFRSMIIDSIHKNQPLNTVLLWSGKEDGCPFVEELNEVAKKDPSLFTKNYVNERLDIDKIKSEVDDLDERIIYLAGSQPFVDGLGDQLMASGIPRSQLKYDWFDGYTEEI